MTIRRIDVSTLPYDERVNIINNRALCPICGTSRTRLDHKACSERVKKMTDEQKIAYGLAPAGGYLKYKAKHK